MKHRVALIPSYEPDDALLKVVDELLNNSFDVVVVNDGSKPSYNEIFDKLPKEDINFLSYETNMGKGHALKHGLAFIKDNYDEGSTIVTLDSDGQHKVSDAIRIVEECENEGGLILGSRQFGKGTPFKSRFGNFMARTSFLISTHHKIYDTQTGLRAFPYSLIDLLLEAKGNRYEYEMNVLLDAIKKDVPIKEVKIETIYLENNAGTHYSPFKDTMRIFKEVLKFSASSFIGFLVDYGLFSLLCFLFRDSTWDHKVLLFDILARIVSASVNFTINYHLVFKKKETLWKAMLKYAGLALFILGCNVGLLWLLHEQLGMNEYLAKIIVEITLFITSWLVQRLFVFRKRRKKE